MSPHELSLAIQAAKKLPKPKQISPPRAGRTLPKGVYPGYKGQFIAKAGAKHIGTFPTVEAAVEGIKNHKRDNAANLQR